MIITVHILVNLTWKFYEMDEKVTLSEQLEENVSPVILINKFNVKPEEVDQFLKAWADDAAYI